MRSSTPSELRNYLELGSVLFFAVSGTLYDETTISKFRGVFGRARAWCITCASSRTEVRISLEEQLWINLVCTGVWYRDNLYIHRAAGSSTDN